MVATDLGLQSDNVAPHALPLDSLVNSDHMELLHVNSIKRIV